MSIPLSFFRLSEKGLGLWRDSRSDVDPEEPSETLRIEWEHFGLSFLIQRTLGRASLDQLPPEVFGAGLGEELGEEMLRETVTLGPAEVSDGAAFMRRLEDAALRASWDPSAMQMLDVYPALAWNDRRSLESLMKAMGSIRAFFERAKDVRESIVVSIVG